MALRLTPFKLVHIASGVLTWLGVFSWFAYCALVQSWVGHRPLNPKPPYVHAVADHGTIYVTADDLHLSHIILLIAAIWGAAGLSAHFLERLWPEGRALHEARRAAQWQRWIAARNARISRERRERT